MIRQISLKFIKSNDCRETDNVDVVKLNTEITVKLLVKLISYLIRRRIDSTTFQCSYLN